MKSSITSNVDHTIDPKVRAETQKLDDLENRIDDHVREEERKGEVASGYQYLGALRPDHILVTKGHAENTAEDIVTRRSQGRPVKPMYMIEDENGDPIWILNDEDAEACRQGYICPNCLSWQKSTLDLDCESIAGFGCGYKRTD